MYYLVKVAAVQALVCCISSLSCLTGNAVSSQHVINNVNRSYILVSNRLGLRLHTDLNESDLKIHSQYVARHKRFVRGSAKWKKKLLSFRIVNYTPDVNLSTTRLAIYHAFDLWSRASSLEFYELLHGTADIVIKFTGRRHGDSYNFDGPGQVLAHAFYPGKHRGGDIHFDEDETWGLSSEKDVDIFLVAAHELGHSLGLGHSENNEALMSPLYEGYIKNFVLPRDDTNGIRQIYGAGLSDDPSRPTLPPLPVHKPKKKKHILEGNPDAMIPNPCLMKYDAVTLFRSERHIFIQKWFWRFNKNGLVPGYPIEIVRFFNTLDPGMKNVDAVYERKDDNNIIIFIGNEYFEYQLTARPHPQLRTTGPLRNLGLPGNVRRIDAALNIGDPPSITYLFSENNYWKIRNKRVIGRGTISTDWPGVPYPLDAVFRHWDGNIYFFKGYKYWQFDFKRKRVTSKGGKLTMDRWMDCKGVQLPVHTTPSSTSSASLFSFSAFSSSLFILYKNFVLSL